jgi:hypothetical protein
LRVRIGGTSSVRAAVILDPVEVEGLGRLQDLDPDRT